MRRSALLSELGALGQLARTAHVFAHHEVERRTKFCDRSVETLLSLLQQGSIPVRTQAQIVGSRRGWTDR